MNRILNSSRLAALAVVATLGTIASSASAVTVAYTTTGLFTGGSPTATMGGSSITFNGTSATTDQTGNPIGATYGTFVLTNVTGSSSFSTSFMLTIAQMFPTVGTGTTTASVSGTVSSTAGSGVVIFDFDSDGATAGNQNVAIGTIVYKINDLSVNIGAADADPIAPGKQSASYELTGTMNIPAGTPNIVPAPEAATAGGLLLGVLSAGRLIQKRRKLAV